MDLLSLHKMLEIGLSAWQRRGPEAENNSQICLNNSNVTLWSSTVAEDSQQEAEHASLNGLQGYAFQIPLNSIEY